MFIPLGGSHVLPQLNVFSRASPTVDRAKDTQNDCPVFPSRDKS